MTQMNPSSERPLLTIAIPTYNRRGCLTQLLEILAPQLAGESRVELIVSDNASPDDTPTVVASFREKGLVLTYSKNETNIGADANVVRCYEMARGEYVWIFGDDDIIVPGALQEVLLRLETRTYDLLFIQSKGFRGQYQLSSAPKISHKIKVFAHPQDFALYVSTDLTFVSGNIFRKASLEHLPQEHFRKLIGTHLPQLSWMFALLSGNPHCACLQDRLVATLVDNSGGHGTCQVFGENMQAIVNEFFGLHTPIGRAILNRTIQSWFPWTMLQSRRKPNSRYLPEDPLSVLGNLYDDNPRYWFFLYPVIRLPLPLAEVWLLAVRAINRMDRLLGYPISR
jgi:glycosyltransferase involved in cell wall biosynthesis